MSCAKLLASVVGATPYGRALKSGSDNTEKPLRSIQSIDDERCEVVQFIQDIDASLQPKQGSYLREAEQRCSSALTPVPGEYR